MGSFFYRRSNGGGTSSSGSGSNGGIGRWFKSGSGSMGGEPAMKKELSAKQKDLLQSFKTQTSRDKV